MIAGIINVYTYFSNYGGAQNIAISLHRQIKLGGTNYLMSFNSFQELSSSYSTKIDQSGYLRFNWHNIFYFRDFVFLSHHRKTTTYLCLLSKIFSLNLRIIHIAHSEFESKRLISRFPKRIIAVSEKVKNNLSSYFKIPKTQIKVIHNGIRDIACATTNLQRHKNGLSILYIGRIDQNKKQIDLVNNIKNDISPTISIHFAGIGEDYEKLNKICQNLVQFECLGFVKLTKIIHSYDYVMLFSQKEGLPLSLIEAGMFSKPCITNSAGGNKEVIIDGFNGYIRNSYRDLAVLLNSLESQNIQQYTKLCMNARKRYEQLFQESTMISEYTAYIRNSF